MINEMFIRFTARLAQEMTGRSKVPFWQVRMQSGVFATRPVVDLYCKDGHTLRVSRLGEQGFNVAYINPQGEEMASKPFKRGIGASDLAKEITRWLLPYDLQKTPGRKVA